METTSESSSRRRSRHSSAQWANIIAESIAMGEQPEQLAGRLGCALSTVEKYRKRATGTPEPAAGREHEGGFVEVRSAPAPLQGALTLQTAGGLRVTFHTLPPPDYLAAALGLAR